MNELELHLLQVAAAALLPEVGAQVLPHLLQALQLLSLQLVEVQVDWPYHSWEIVWCLSKVLA